MKKKIKRAWQWLWLSKEQRAITRSYKDCSGARGAARIAAIYHCYDNRVPIKAGKTILPPWALRTLLRGNEQLLLRQMIDPARRDEQPAKDKPVITVAIDCRPGYPMRYGLDPIVDYAEKNDARVARAVQEMRAAEERFAAKHPEFYKENPDMFVV